MNYCMVNRKKCISFISSHGQCRMFSPSQNPTCCKHNYEPGSTLNPWYEFSLWQPLHHGETNASREMVSRKMLVEKWFKAPLTVAT